MRKTLAETLRAIAKSEPCTVEELSRRMGLALSSARGRMATLRRYGLIRELETMASGAVPFELSYTGRRALVAAGDGGEP